MLMASRPSVVWRDERGRCDRVPFVSSREERKTLVKKEPKHFQKEKDGQVCHLSKKKKARFMGARLGIAATRGRAT